MSRVQPQKEAEPVLKRPHSSSYVEAEQINLRAVLITKAYMKRSDRRNQQVQVAITKPRLVMRHSMRQGWDDLQYKHAEAQTPGSIRVLYLSSHTLALRFRLFFLQLQRPLCATLSVMTALLF